MKIDISKDLLRGSEDYNGFFIFCWPVFALIMPVIVWCWIGVKICDLFKGFVKELK